MDSSYEAPQAYLIDLDGTLANTLPTLYYVYQTFLSNHGRQGSELEFSQLNGPSLPEVVQQLALRHQIRTPFSDLYRDYSTLAKRCYVSHTALFPGALTFIERARSSGKSLLLVTSAERPLATAFLASHGLTNAFAACVTPEGLPRSKPDPAIYERALEVAGLPAEGCVAIEDSLQGIASAQGAGIRTILIQHEGTTPLLPPEGILATASGWSDLTSRLEANE